MDGRRVSLGNDFLRGSALDGSRGLKFTWIKQPVPMSPPIGAVQTRRDLPLRQVLRERGPDEYQHHRRGEC